MSPYICQSDVVFAVLLALRSYCEQFRKQVAPGTLTQGPGAGCLPRALEMDKMVSLVSHEKSSWQVNRDASGGCPEGRTTDSCVGRLR